jgi:dsRNA-specific ribonuclease
MKLKIKNHSKYKMNQYKDAFFAGRIYLGPRDDSFKNLISKLLEIGGIKKKYIDELLSPEALTYFGTAFTHPTASTDNNYEFLETLGDLTLNKAIGWYLARRFPQINCPQGKDILTRLKIQLIQTKGFVELAEPLGFWNFISCDLETRASIVSKNKILEDVFESIFGALEFYIDAKYNIGVGYTICYKIISRLLDLKNISLKYEMLVDAKTRLKEIFDLHKNTLGTIEYIKENMPGVDIEYVANAIQYLPNKTRIIIGRGKALSKSDAEKMAAEQAIDVLAKQGYFKIVPDEYKRFNK